MEAWSRQRALVGLVPGGIQSATADGFQAEEPALARPPGWPLLLALLLLVRPCAGGVAGGSAGSPAWLASRVRRSTCRASPSHNVFQHMTKRT
jgi:hypothetical protein